MRVIGYSIVSKLDGKPMQTTKSARPSAKIYKTEASALRTLAIKVNPIRRIMEKYPLQASKYQSKLDELLTYKVIPLYIFESDLE
jgi:hypothetical protein